MLAIEPKQQKGLKNSNTLCSNNSRNAKKNLPDIEWSWHLRLPGSKVYMHLKYKQKR